MGLGHRPLTSRRHIKTVDDRIHLFLLSSSLTFTLGLLFLSPDQGLWLQSSRISTGNVEILRNGLSDAKHFLQVWILPTPALCSSPIKTQHFHLLPAKIINYYWPQNYLQNPEQTQKNNPFYHSSQPNRVYYAQRVDLSCAKTQKYNRLEKHQQARNNNYISRCRNRNWTFAVLKRFGFGKSLSRSPCASVRTNNQLSQRFRLQRGTRRGCPHSPSLCNIYWTPGGCNLAKQDHLRFSKFQSVLIK